MPRVLADDEAAVWLDGGEELRETASRVPGAQVREELTTCPVDRRVGNVAVNGPELIRGTGDAEATMGE
jgi:putative SOS response-associated peptidase YedK